MRIDVFTIFPGLIDAFCSESLLGKARTGGLLDLRLHDPREHTTDRLIHREGWIAKRSMEIPLEAINDVRFEQGIWDRIVGAGTLRISSASEFGTSSFTHIRHPEEVQKTIYHQGERNKKRMYQGDEAAPAVPPAPAATTSLSCPRSSRCAPRRRPRRRPPR